MISWTAMIGMPYSSSATRKVINCSLSSSVACDRGLVVRAGSSPARRLQGRRQPRAPDTVEQRVLIQEHHQAATGVELDDALEELPIDALHNRGRLFHVLGADVHDLAHGVDDQSGRFAMELDDHDPVVLGIVAAACRSAPAS